MARFCRENNLSEDVEFEMNLTMEELFANAVRHGSCRGVPGVVRIRLDRTSDGVRAEFADRGAPFDPTGAPAPDLEAPLDERPTGGLGLHLVRQTMRDLEYRRVDGWNVLTMVRPIPARESQ